MAEETHTPVSKCWSCRCPACWSAALLLVIHTCIITAGSASGDISEKCRQWGFNEAEVRCSDCAALGEFVRGDADLVSECRQCCVWGEDEGDKAKYIRAELQLCPMRLQSQGEIKWFVDKLAHKYEGSLSITYINNIAPRLKLFKAEGGVDTLRVDNWGRVTFTEFMQDRVVQPTQAQQ